MNFDGVVFHSTSVTIGFMIRDDIGNPFLVGEKKSYSLSVQVSEAYYLLLKFKVTLSLLSIIFVEAFSSLGISNDLLLILKRLTENLI